MKNRFIKWLKILCISAIVIIVVFVAYVAYLMHSSSTPQKNTDSQTDQSIQTSETDTSADQEQIEDRIDLHIRNELKRFGTSKENISISLSESSASSFLKSLNATDSIFRFEKYYHLEDVLSLYKGSKVKAKSNASTLVNGNGKLDGEKLTRLVLKNNEELMSQGKNNLNAFYSELSTGEIQWICGLIAEVVNEELFGIAVGDAATTLEELTIFQRTGSASNAYVTNNLTLVFNPTMTEMYGDISEISGIMENPEDAKEAVLVHEIMHLLQYAASDNDSTNGMEAGICHMYNVPEQDPLVDVDSLWYTWLLDGSAELGMASYLQLEPGTYQKKISYVKSYNLSRFHELDLEKDGLEQIAFAPTLDQGFSRLHLDEQEEQEQILKYLYSIEITQADPDDFIEAYMSESSESLTEEQRTGLRMDIRTDALTYLTRNFYENLAQGLLDGKISDSDTLFYLMRTWELDLYNHLKYNEPANLAHCEDFILWHDEIQNHLFQAVADSIGQSAETLKSLYKEYYMHHVSDEETNAITSNASLKEYNSYNANYILDAKETYTSSSFSLNTDMATYIRKQRAEK